jgi:hypothetical protein
MHFVVTAQHAVQVGTPVIVEGASPGSRFVGVFEDDGDTGYFYALNMGRTDQPIVEAIHIYNVANVTDRAHESSVEIGWSTDGLKAALLINGRAHAIYDFVLSQGHRRYENGGEFDNTVRELFP